MNIANDLFSQALGLPAEQREQLAVLLWESLPEDDRPFGLAPEYEAEVLRRIEEIDSGRARMLGLDEVMATLRGPSGSQASR